MFGHIYSLELLGFELYPSSDVPKSTKHGVPETRSVSILRWGEGVTLLGPSPHKRTERDPVSKKLFPNF
jgi:hypothetical protein